MSYGESPKDKMSNYMINDNVDSTSYPKDDDFSQVGDLYRLMSTEEKERLTSNIALTMVDIPKEIVNRQIDLFKKADKDYGEKVLSKLKKLSK